MKQATLPELVESNRSLPTRERGLKHYIINRDCEGYRSLPTRERGLKHNSRSGQLYLYRSLPTRERGLKQFIERHSSNFTHVAPYAGAWIETCVKPFTIRIVASLPTRERGLKQDDCIDSNRFFKSLPSLDEFHNFFLGNDISHITQEYSSIVV